MAIFKKNTKNIQIVSQAGMGIEVRVGIVEQQTHPSGLDMAYLQVIHHYGKVFTEETQGDPIVKRTIPARDVYNTPMENRKKEIMARIQHAIKGESIDRGFTGEKFAEITGEAVLEEAVLHTFRTGEGLALNAPSTIKAKGSASPLVDEGDLMKAQAWKVVKK